MDHNKQETLTEKFIRETNEFLTAFLKEKFPGENPAHEPLIINEDGKVVTESSNG